jgi:anti-sigma B factor antagonist
MMNPKDTMKQSKKVKIAPESTVKITIHRINENLSIIDIEDKLMTDEHIQLLHNAAKEMLKEGCKNFIIDLSMIKRINSMGLGSLISLYTSIRNEEGTMIIGGMNEFVKNVLNITKLIEIFEVYPTKEDAVNSLK